MISPGDVDLLQVTDDPQRVVEIIREARERPIDPPLDTSIG